AVAPRARMESAHSSPRQLHAVTFSTLKAGERPVKGRGRGKGPLALPRPLTGLLPAFRYCVSITGLYLWTNQPYGDACPDNRHDTRVPIHPTRSSTTFPPFDSTDNSSPYVSCYAAPRTGSGAGVCSSARRTPRESAPPPRSSAPRQSRTYGSRSAT